MASSLVIAGHHPGDVEENSGVHYGPVAGMGVPRHLSEEPQVTSELPVRHAGAFDQLYFFLISNTVNVSGSTVTLQKNLTDTSLSISVGAAQTGVFEDTTNSVSFVATDEVNWEYFPASDPGGARAWSIGVLSTRFTPDDTSLCVQWLSCNGSRAIIANNEIAFPVINGSFWVGTDQDESDARMRGAFTLSHLYVYAEANARTSNTTFETWINNAAGNQSVTYSSAQTGAKEDTSNTDAIVAGDDLQYRYTTGAGAGEAFDWRRLACLCVSTARQFPFIAGNSRTNVTVAAGATEYASLHGGLVWDVTEANFDTRPQFDITAKELAVKVLDNSIDAGTSVLTVRKGRASSSLAVSVGFGATGLFSDTTDSVEAVAGVDQLGIEMVVSGASGTLNVPVVFLLGETEAPPTESADLFWQMPVGHIAE